MIAHAWKEGRGFWVAQSVGEGPQALGGFITYGQFRGGIGYAHTMEHTIIVDEGARGQGLGMRLMQDALDHASGAGVHSMWAGVSAENPAGVEFHTRAGFETVARLPQVGRKFGRWIDLILMQKILKPS